MFQHIEKGLTDEQSAQWFDICVQLPYHQGIKSRRYGPTRLACALSILKDALSAEHNFFSRELQELADKYLPGHKVSGIYINFYRDGKMFTPMHRHTNTVQMVVSLGASRTFKINTRTMLVKDSDIVIFGSQPHGILREPECETSRFSVACFLTPSV